MTSVGRMNLDLVGPHEIAERLGVAQETVHRWRVRGRLPLPFCTISRVPIWHWVDIEKWAQATNRLPLDS